MTTRPQHDRRQFLQFLLASPLAMSAALSLSSSKSYGFPQFANPETLKQVLNISHLDKIASQKLPRSTYHLLVGGSGDQRTSKANEQAYQDWEIRARRLINVSQLSTEVELFGNRYLSPIILSPIGGQLSYNPEGELATAKAANYKKNLMIASTVSSYGVEDIAKHTDKLWFQLYPHSNRKVMKQLIDQSIVAGCNTIVLTIDGPVRGTNQAALWFRKNNQTAKTPFKMGNFDKISHVRGLGDPTLTWDIIQWLRDNTNQRIILKGIVTKEDAQLCLSNGVDGIIVSNHGGRQEDSGRATLDCLPEIAEVINQKIPILIDGGIRRGSDIFKAIALGANAVCIGRPYIWGLSAFGEKGVKKCLSLLQNELEEIMMLAGTPSIEHIKRPFLTEE